METPLMSSRRGLLVLAASSLALFTAGCGGPSDAPAVAPANSTEVAVNAPEAGANGPETASNSADPSAEGAVEAAAKDGGKPVPIVMETSQGTIELALYPDKAPITVKNFVEYVKKGHYDGTIFHRVIDGFMIQGGGFTADMTEKPTGPPIKNEAENGLKNDRGTIAMARTGDPDSATAQFFINVNPKGNDGLNYPNANGYGYAVFGKVTKGMDVVDKIRKAPTTSKNGMDDVPVDTITIKSVKTSSPAAAPKG
jgi:peptidyl-prolyl cis-trans isomerase A (cyclophilin A)